MNDAGKFFFASSGLLGCWLSADGPAKAAKPPDEGLAKAAKPLDAGCWLAKAANPVPVPDPNTD